MTTITKVSQRIFRLINEKIPIPLKIFEFTFKGEPLKKKNFLLNYPGEPLFTTFFPKEESVRISSPQLWQSLSLESFVLPSQVRASYVKAVPLNMDYFAPEINIELKIDDWETFFPNSNKLLKTSAEIGALLYINFPTITDIEVRKALRTTSKIKFTQGACNLEWKLEINKNDLIFPISLSTFDDLKFFPIPFQKGKRISLNFQIQQNFIGGTRNFVVYLFICLNFYDIERIRIQSTEKKLLSEEFEVITPKEQYFEKKEILKKKYLDYTKIFTQGREISTAADPDDIIVFMKNSISLSSLRFIPYSLDERKVFLFFPRIEGFLRKPFSYKIYLPRLGTGLHSLVFNIKCVKGRINYLKCKLYDLLESEELTTYLGRVIISLFVRTDKIAFEITVDKDDEGVLSIDEFTWSFAGTEVDFLAQHHSFPFFYKLISEICPFKTGGIVKGLSVYIPPRIGTEEVEDWGNVMPPYHYYLAAFHFFEEGLLLKGDDLVSFSFSTYPSFKYLLVLDSKSIFPNVSEIPFLDPEFNIPRDNLKILYLSNKKVLEDFKIEKILYLKEGENLIQGRVKDLLTFNEEANMPSSFFLLFSSFIGEICLSRFLLKRGVQSLPLKIIPLSSLPEGEKYRVKSSFKDEHAIARESTPVKIIIHKKQKPAFPGVF